MVVCRGRVRRRLAPVHRDGGDIRRNDEFGLVEIAIEVGAEGAVVRTGDRILGAVIATGMGRGDVERRQERRDEDGRQGDGDKTAAMAAT